MLHSLTVWRGGAERLLFTLANRLSRLGYEVDIYTLRDDPARCYPEMRRSMTVTSTSQLASQRIFGAIPVLHALEMAMNIKDDYDIIHAHNFPSNLAALFATSLRRGLKNTPYLWQCNEPHRLLHDPRERNQYTLHASQLPPIECMTALAGLKGLDISSRMIDMLAARRASVVTTLSDHVAKTIRSLYGRTAAVVNPGVDNTFFSARNDGTDIRASYGIGVSKMILTVSRLWPAKNIETCIRAFKILLTYSPDTYYMIVGDGPSKGTLQALSRSLGVDGRCIFVSDSKVENRIARFYSACDVFLFTGVEEPWGLAVLEAMASRKPVVVSEKAGPAEFVEHMRSGILVDPLDPVACAMAVRQLLKNPGLAIEMGNKAALRAALYSWERMARAYDRIYGSILDGDRSSCVTLN